MIDNLKPGGTEFQLLALIRSVDRSRIRPYLCLMDGQGEPLPGLQPVDCPTFRLGVRSFRNPATFLAARRFARFLRRQRIDVLQTHFPDSTYFAAPVARVAGVPCIVRTKRSLGHSMTRWQCRRARLCNWWVDATLANCDACRRAAIEQERADPDSVVVIPNGIDLDVFARVPPVPSTGNGSHRRVGMVANLRPVKAPEVLIRAARILRTSHPNVTFQIAGMGDEGSASRHIGQSGMREHFELTGLVDDVAAFLGRLDVAVLTSLSEGLSNALLEYMAAGRPIVATAVGGNVELIEDGVNGLLVAPGDPEALAAAIDRLLRRPALAARLGTQARCCVAQQNSWETIARRHETFYSELLGR